MHKTNNHRSVATIDNVKIGDILEIRKSKYEVLQIKTQTTIALAPLYETHLFREAYLHKTGDHSLVPKHTLRIFIKTH